MREASAELAGAVGEWVQGWLLADGEALVSLVIPWRGRVTVGEGLGDDLPAKATSALAIARRRLGRPTLGAEIDNPLPIGKGLASSTVDVCGLLAAASLLDDRPWEDEEIFALGCSVEPSDGLVFPGLALVDHLRGHLIELLPPPPPLALLALVPPRSLDTESYRRDPSFQRAIRARAQDHRQAYEWLRQGLLLCDGSLVAKGATLSARTQNDLFPRPEWPLLERGLQEPGALGIALAHSGTASALIFCDRPSAERAWALIKDDFTGLLSVVEPCGGGILPAKNSPSKGEVPINLCQEPQTSRRCPV